ncbi:hypothetical protein BZF66_05970 [Salmonella enterica]|uniref:hypothetical protein n=1 Tax=Salmonella enterica TaxID=28901 RepID=UPI000FDF854C|nr:hypothetical protein CPT_Munch_041 [Salmonella phage Munch]EAR2661108.1 hypothetical protein [Salmonella enterica]ECV9083974.1 hypothetical protein [Salmonella enterica subsp. enterica serovar Infantis]MCP0435925.1 hypothetical protein [Salmonella enterica subsp. enterica serovar Mbandaka]WNV47147.1 hypothetical protein [Klebsiella phage fENko-Kae01]
MKYLLIIAALFSTQAMATDMVCSADGFQTVFKVDGNTLIDTNEHVVAEEISTGKFMAQDQFGEVVYTIHGNKIVMQFSGVIKEYNCK